MGRQKVYALDFFVGGVPPYVIFKLDTENIKQLVAPLKGNEHYKTSTTIEVAFIGAVAYFEAFFQNLFAATINIYPSLIHDFCKKRGPVTVNIIDVLQIRKPGGVRLAFLLLNDIISPWPANNAYTFPAPSTTSSCAETPNRTSFLRIATGTGFTSSSRKESRNSATASMRTA